MFNPRVSKDWEIRSIIPAPPQTSCLESQTIDTSASVWLTTEIHGGTCSRGKWVGPSTKLWNPGLFKLPRCLGIWLGISYSNQEVCRKTIYETNKSTTAPELRAQSPVDLNVLSFQMFLHPLSTQGVPRYTAGEKNEWKMTALDWSHSTEGKTGPQKSKAGVAAPLTPTPSSVSGRNPDG